MRIRRDKLAQVVSKIGTDRKDIHVSGEPGTDKTSFLDAIEEELSSEIDVIRLTALHHNSPRVLYRDLLSETRSRAPIISSKKNALVGLQLNVPGVGGGGTLDDRQRDLRKFEKLVDNWLGRLVIMLGDVHKISESKEEVSDVVEELASVLPTNVSLVTAGQISGVPSDEEIHLNLFTLEQTREFINHKFGEVTDETIREVHEGVEGHPVYLEMLTESSDEEGLEIPDDEVLRTIEKEYLDSLSVEEREFLQTVSALPELDPVTCSQVVPEISEVEAEDILESLAHRVTVQKVNRTDSGYSVYKIHEVCRRALYQRLNNKEEIHRLAFRSEVSKLMRVIGNMDEVEGFVSILPHTILAQHHLEMIHGEPTVEAFSEELEKMEVDYPSRLFVSVYFGAGAFPSQFGELLELELRSCEEWIESVSEFNRAQQELVLEFSWWIASKFDNGIENRSLTDIEVSGSLGDLPELPAAEEELDMQEEHAEQLQRARDNFLRFFLTQEPFDSKKTPSAR